MSDWAESVVLGRARFIVREGRSRTIPAIQNRPRPGFGAHCLTDVACGNWDIKSWQFLPFYVMYGIVRWTSKKEVRDAEHEHFFA